MSFSRPSSVTIIGAGVVGLATAYALAKDGFKITLVDRNNGPAEGASHANGGQLSYLYTDALASPKLIKQMPGFVLGRDPAFRFHWRVDFPYWRWLAQFLCNCTKARFDKNTKTALTLARESQQAMKALLESQQLQFGHRVSGKMHLYADAAAFETACGVMKMKNGACESQLALTSDEAAEREPALVQQHTKLAGVIYSPDEEVGDAMLFALQITELLQREYGMECHWGKSVRTMRITDDSAELTLSSGEVLTSDHVTICAGVAAPKLAASRGHHLPIQPLKGYSFTAPPGPNPPKTSITDAARRLVFTNLGNRIRVAGLADLGDRSDEVKPKRMASLIEAARASLPDAADYGQATEFWAGHRPMTPNSMPIIARPENRLSINAGHGMLGWTLAMGSGERLARLLA